MDNKKLRNLSVRGDESPHLQEAAEWLESFLDGIPYGEKWTTRQVIDTLTGRHPDLTPRVLNQALWRLRDSGELEGWWSRDNTRRFMGNALILWHRPAAPQGETAGPEIF